MRYCAKMQCLSHRRGAGEESVILNLRIAVPLTREHTMFSSPPPSYEKSVVESMKNEETGRTVPFKHDEGTSGEINIKIAAFCIKKRK